MTTKTEPPTRPIVENRFQGSVWALIMAEHAPKGVGNLDLFEPPPGPLQRRLHLALLAARLATVAKYGSDEQVSRFAKTYDA